MANILVLGVGPLPFEPTQRLHAPGIRTWQIASAIASKRHFVTLCIIDFGDFQADGKARPAVRQELGSNISLVRLSYSPTGTVASIRTLHVATRFAAIVSSSDIMNGMAADLELDVPLWLDYNGDPFGEKQLQALVYSHDGSLLPQWELYLKGLLHGDRFSVCSNPQRHAMIGQLAFSGRLSGINSGEELVHVVPNCSRAMAERTPLRSKPLKGSKIPATAFLVLWTGGYNTWCDPETLFAGLELAMAQNSLVHFATTGGAIDGHDSKSFEVFKSLVEQSSFRERYIFLGWVPTEEVGYYYEQADMAIFNDRYSVEGELGTRTRIIDWMQYELPIACTVLCELTRDLARKNLIQSFEIGSPESLADAIVWVQQNPAAAKDRAVAAKKWFEANLDEAKAFAPMLEWVSNPEYALDRKTKLDTLTVIDRDWLTPLSRIQHNGLTAAFAGSRGKETPALKPPPSPENQDGGKKRLFSIFGRKN